MSRLRPVLPLLLIVLLAACSRETRQAIATRVFPSAGTAAHEGAVVLLTAAVEAAQTNAPIARTLGAQAVSTGGPILRTAVHEGAVIGGTIGAEALATGGPLARTAVARGVSAAQTRRAEQPNYICPADTYSVDTDLNTTVDISGAQLDAAIAATVPGSPLIGLGDAFADAARARGMNAYYVAAHAAWDSTWGTSAVATRKNNLFGYGVTVTCPFDCAVPFNTQQESIDIVMTLVKNDYLTPGGRFFTTPTLRGMEPIYSGNPNWDDGIAAIMNLLRQNTPCG